MNDGQEEYSIGFSSSGSATPISYFFFRGKHWEISYDIQDLEFIATVKPEAQLSSVDVLIYIYLHESESDTVPASIPVGMPNDTYTVSVKPHNFCFCKCYMYVYIDTRDTLCMHIQGLYVEKACISLHFLYSSIFSLHTMAFHIASYRLIPYHTIPHSFHFDLSET